MSIPYVWYSPSETVCKLIGALGDRDHSDIGQAETKGSSSRQRSSAMAIRPGSVWGHLTAAVRGKVAQAAVAYIMSARLLPMKKGSFVLR